MEVLVALALVAIGLTGVTLALTQNTRTVAAMEARMAADIAARNLIDRHLLPLKEGRKPPVAPQQGQVEMGGFTFNYQQEITPAALEGLVKLTVSVQHAQNGTTLRQLSTYVAR